MKAGTEPLYKRLHLDPKWWSYKEMEASIPLATRLPPKPSDFNRAWAKANLPFTRFLLSLACYYAGEIELARNHGKKCIEECDEFFFGDWRNTYKTGENQIDPGWWKRETEWMWIFECALVWGSVLGEWQFLAKVGAFPESDSYIFEDYIPQDRNMYVAIGRLLCDDSKNDLEDFLRLAEVGPRVYCRLLVPLIRAVLARDTNLFQERLTKYLRHYVSEKFPEEKFTSKISIHGTVFVHWAEKEGLAIKVPPEYADHIVRM
jgi:hypothetical protein